MSLWRVSENGCSENICGDLSDKYKMSELFKSFAAGILEHYPALFQLLAPHHNSVRRFIDGYWVGNYACWGIDNKEAPIRVVQANPPTKEGKGGGVTNLEIKSFDHCSNMFLAFSALIMCGLDGIKRKMQLPLPINIDPSSLTIKEQNELGIKRIPKSINEKADYLLGRVKG